MWTLDRPFLAWSTLFAFRPTTTRPHLRPPTERPTVVLWRLRPRPLDNFLRWTPPLQNVPCRHQSIAEGGGGGHVFCPPSFVLQLPLSSPILSLSSTLTFRTRGRRRQRRTHRQESGPRPAAVTGAAMPARRSWHFVAPDSIPSRRHFNNAATASNFQGMGRRTAASVRE